MPTESHSSSVPGTHTVRYWNTSPYYTAPPSETTTPGYVVRTFSMSRSSVNTPRFKSMKKPRNLPMNSFSFSQDKYEFPFSSTGVVDSNWSAYWGGFSNARYSGVVTAVQAHHAFPPLSPTMSQITALDAKVVTKLRNDLKDQSINLAQAYAERRMTADLIADTALKLAKAVNQLKKGNLRDAADTLGVKVSRRAIARHKRDHAKSQQEATASGWLGLQYGWTPLLNDVYGAAKFLADKQYAEIITKATASSSIVIKDFQAINSAGKVIYLTYDTTYTIKYGVYFSSSYGMHTLAQTGFSNPALLAWELLPWSFVADWFLPIGNYLASLDATLGLSFLKGYKTVFTRQSSKSLVAWSAPLNPGTGSTIRNGVCRDSWEKINVTRSVLTDFPSAQFPSFKNPVSLVHAANAIALLRTSFR